MEDKVLQKAMEAAVKVFDDANYRVSSKTLTENGSVVEIKIVAEPSRESSVDFRYQVVG